MKIITARSGMPAMLAAALMVLTTPATAYYTTGEDPTPEQAQAYQDAQGCVVVLKTAGGEANEKLAEASLAKAKELAAINGDDTDEKFAKSMSDWEEILKMASPEESAQFLTNCQKGLVA